MYEVESIHFDTSRPYALCAYGTAVWITPLGNKASGKFQTVKQLNMDGFDGLIEQGGKFFVLSSKVK